MLTYQLKKNYGVIISRDYATLFRMTSLFLPSVQYVQQFYAFQKTETQRKVLGIAA